ncbi:EAL domain-containing protein [Erwinia sp. MMLR14_017]|uniref:EAL domain-containing protein n=1 Tax=Erwinia sp. MMLR14_017 TaxID=3093842 RepID=UPI00298F7E8C|nr:EAL domain-containing protein [Erwinia sp. MMLR14_017]MDW8845231.1 EAL domain-containing protein [Erwinia sp. MMLR14_017]
MDSIFKRTPERKGLLLTIAGLTPLLLCLIFTFIDARQIVMRQQAVTAAMLLTQAEAISDQAWNMIGYLRKLSGKRCSDINEQLQQYASQFPYFRAIGLMQDGVVTCSSIYGGLRGDLSTMLLRPAPEPRKARWMLSLSGTFSVKDRPAVIYMRDLPNQFSSYAVVEGQYLLDFMHAVGKSHGYNISLQFGGGYAIDSGFTPTDRPSLLRSHTLTASSGRYPVVATIISPPADLALTWREGLMTYFPMAIIFSLLLMMVTNNWLKRKLSIHDQLRQALLRREFSVHYQPVYNIETGTFSGVEALMRWQLPNGNWARPDLFIGAAEEEEMIVPLTQHLLQTIAKEARSWQVPPGFHIAINIAGEHIQHPDFVADIRNFAAQVASHQPTITLELTERSLISDGDEVIQKLKTLRREGVRIAIDDFGTGHCSLSYLQTFPLDYLKIDRGFVNAIESAEEEAPVLDAIIMLSHKLKLSIVAEGVETAKQLAYLQARGVIFIQGYLYARPMNSEALMAWFQQEGQHPLSSSPRQQGET